MGAVQVMAAKCGAMARTGRPCTRPAGWGTNHVGFGNCKMHLGATAKGEAHGAKLAALAQIPALGGEVDINPLEALLYTVRRAYALAGYYRLQAEARDLAGEDVEPYATLERQALGDLNQWAQRSVGAGVAERMVRIAERTGGILAAALEDALAGAELTASERSAVVARFAQALSRLERDAPTITAKAEDV